MSLFFLASKDRKYDANGNNTSQSEVDKYFWSYNDANRMSEFKVGSTIRGQYHHNAIGQRVHKSQYKTNGTLAGEFLFVYDEQGQLVHVSKYKNGEHKWDRETIWLGNRPVARVETNYSAGAVTSQNIYYIQTDHLNTPRWITDDVGTRIWSWESDAFGSTAPDMDVDGDGVNFYFYMRFPGQYFDVESGLHYNYFRDYEPGVGRYVESDPIGLNAGMNTYSYVLSNPLYWTDKRGLINDNSLCGGLPYEQQVGCRNFFFPPPLTCEEGGNCCENSFVNCYSSCTEYINNEFLFWNRTETTVAANVVYNKVKNSKSLKKIIKKKCGKKGKKKFKKFMKGAAKKFVAAINIIEFSSIGTCLIICGKDPCEF